MYHDEFGQPATDDWLYLTGQEESEARLDSGVPNKQQESDEWTHQPDEQGVSQ